MLLSQDEQYTYHRSVAAEALIGEVIGEVAELVGRVVPASRINALVLIGGYGRGEGGVRQDDAGERPNNNLDFLLIFRGQLDPDWQVRIDEGLSELQQRFAISLDFSSVSDRLLQRSPCRLMWYDMRCGHKTVLGDRSFLPSLSQFGLQRVPSWDVHNLLVNRGTLLVINDCLASQSPTASMQQIYARHTTKAVIGYGDALLYSRGAYDWSYAEKQRRMRLLVDVEPTFRELYDVAAEQRFRPSSSIPDCLDDIERVRQACESVHREFESRRLGLPTVKWDSYLPAALRRSLLEDTSPRGCARSVRNLCRLRGHGGRAWQAERCRAGSHFDTLAQLGLRALSRQRLLGLLFPAVAYRDCGVSFRAHAAALLDCTTSGRSELRAGYLRAWGDTVDRNFARFLSRFQLSLEPTGGET